MFDNRYLGNIWIFKSNTYIFIYLSFLVTLSLLFFVFFFSPSFYLLFPSYPFFVYFFSGHCSFSYYFFCITRVFFLLLVFVSFFSSFRLLFIYLSVLPGFLYNQPNSSAPFFCPFWLTLFISSVEWFCPPLWSSLFVPFPLSFFLFHPVIYFQFATFSVLSNLSSPFFFCLSFLLFHFLCLNVFLPFMLLYFITSGFSSC